MTIRTIPTPCKECRHTCVDTSQSQHRFAETERSHKLCDAKYVPSPYIATRHVVVVPMCCAMVLALLCGGMEIHKYVCEASDCGRPPPFSQVRRGTTPRVSFWELAITAGTSNGGYSKYHVSVCGSSAPRPQMFIVPRGDRGVHEQPCVGIF